MENKRKKAMVDELQRKGFDSDPVRRWKKAQQQEQVRGRDGRTVFQGCQAGDAMFRGRGGRGGGRA